MKDPGMSVSASCLGETEEMIVREKELLPTI